MTQEPDQVPCLTPLVRGAPSITPKMVFWQGRYISVAQLYVELLSSKEDDKNWKGIIISIGCISLILMSVIVSVVILTPEEVDKKSYGRRIQISDLIDRSLQPTSFKGHWISDKEITYIDESFELVSYNAEDNKTIVLLDKWIISQFLTITGDSEVQFYVTLDKRHAVLTQSLQLMIINIDKRSVVNQFSTKEEPSIVVSQSKIYFVDNGLLYVWDEIDQLVNTTLQVGNIWYKSKLWGSDQQIWLSNNESFLAIASNIGDEHDGRQVNKELPHVRISVLSVGNVTNTIHLDLDSQISVSSQFYVSNIGWTPREDLSVSITTRNQSFTTIFLCQPPTFLCSQVYSDHGSWGLQMKTSATSSVMFSKYDDGILLIKHIRNGPKQISNQLVKVIPGLTVSTITFGKVTVTSILYWSEEDNIVYFLAHPEDQPQEQHVYSVDIPSQVSHLSLPECLTCSQLTNCSFAEAKLSRNGNFWYSKP